MRKACCTKYHKQVKFIHGHKEGIRAKNFASSFLNKDSISLLKGTGENYCTVIDGHSTSKDNAGCFAESCMLLSCI